MEVLTLVLAIGLIVMVTLGFALLVFFIGMRRNSPVVMRLVVGLSRSVFNPRQMRSAGTPGAFAGIVKNRGRTSGQEYETPVGIVEFGDGFAISLPYGTSANWMRNVLVAGEATIVHEGETIAVDAPELVPIGQLDDAFTTSERRIHSLFGISHALRLRRAEAAGAKAGPGKPSVLLAARA